jgi:hypothetical protein
MKTNSFKKWQELRSDRIKKYAQILDANHSVLLKDDVHVRPIVMQMVRIVSEVGPLHSSVIWRSNLAIEEIGQIIYPSPSAYDEHCWKNKNLKHEHIVPCKAVYEMLLNRSKDKSFNESKAFDYYKMILNRFCIRATITIKEDKCLNKLGLRTEMPNGLSDSSSDPFARYKKAQIKGVFFKFLDVE